MHFDLGGPDKPSPPSIPFLAQLLDIMYYVGKCAVEYEDLLLWLILLSHLNFDERAELVRT